MARDIEVRFARDPMYQRLERQMDDLMGHLLRRATPSAYRRGWQPRVDVFESELDFVAIAELAGVDPDGVTIEVVDRDIRITGERPSPSAEGCADGNCLQLEIPFGTFERAFRLPSPVEASGATANFDRGLLTVRLPKRRRGAERVRVELE